MVKRQKIDASNRFTAGVFGAPLQEGSAALSEQSFQQETLRELHLVDKGGETGLIKKEVDEEAIQVPPFPRRPDRLITKRLAVVGRYSKCAPREEVQSKPYSLEVPKSAPQYGNNGNI